MDFSSISLSVVVPCYNSEITINQLVELLKMEIEKVSINDFEILLVNDYSEDDTWKEIENVCKKYCFVKGVSLAKNFGQHAALLAGLRKSSKEFVLCMDDDLQTHPNQIQYLLIKILDGYDVVYGRYETYKQNILKKTASWFFNLILTSITNKPKNIKATNFSLLRRFVVDEIIKYTGPFPSLSNLIFRTTSNIGIAEIEHFKRFVGKSNYTIKKMMSLFVTVTSYSIAPLRFASYFGMFTSLAGFLFMAYLIIRKIINPNYGAGWTSLMASILFFSGVILLCIGISGEYIGRLFIHIGEEPQYVIREVLNEDNDTKKN